MPFFIKRLTLLLFMWPWLVSKVHAQEAPKPDTLLVVNLSEERVTAKRMWENDTVRYRYNQTKYYVTTVLPYVKEASAMFGRINEKLQQPNISKKERKAYLKSQEAVVKNRFEEKIKDLNTTQGVLLLKLIARQTGLNVYHMIDETKGTVSAVKFQTWALVQGYNLNKKYNPEDEPMLEHIMEGLGYELPSFYQEKKRPD